MKNNELTKEPAKEYLTFWLGKEFYGIDILTVQEIRTYEDVTTIVNMPDFIKGVMNLRGIVIPIVDMRLKFNLEEVTYHEMTVVIILNIGDRVVGIVVDGVSDVISLKKEQIQAPPKLSGELDIQFIEGLASDNELMIILIKIEQLINSQEIALFDQITSDEDDII